MMPAAAPALPVYTLELQARIVDLRAQLAAASAAVPRVPDYVSELQGRVEHLTRQLQHAEAAHLALESGVRELLRAAAPMAQRKGADADLVLVFTTLCKLVRLRGSEAAL